MSEQSSYFGPRKRVAVEGCPSCQPAISGSGWRTAYHRGAFISAHHVDASVSHWYLEPWPFPFPATTSCLSACLYFIAPPCCSSFLHTNMLFFSWAGRVLGFNWWKWCPLCGQGFFLPWVSTQSQINSLFILPLLFCILSILLFCTV